MPRYMATTSDGTKLGPTMWAGIVGTTKDAIESRHRRLKAAQVPADPTASHALTEGEKSSLRGAKSALVRKPEAAARLVASLGTDERLALASALHQQSTQTPISEKRKQESEAALAPLDRTVNSFAAMTGTVSLIDRATDEINEAVGRNGLGAEALTAIEEAIERLVAAVSFAKEMGGVA